MTLPDFKEWAVLMKNKSNKQIEQDLKTIFSQGLSLGRNVWMREWDEHAQASEEEARKLLDGDMNA